MGAVVDLWRRGPSFGVLRSPPGLILVVLTVGVLATYANWSVKRGFTPLAAVNVVVIVAFVVTAVLLFEQSDQRGTSLLFGLTGLCWMALWAGYFRPGPMPFIGFVIGPLFAPLGAWALLRYPEPRLSRRYERYFVAVAIVWVGTGGLTLAAAAEPRRLARPVWWPPTLGLDEHVVFMIRQVFWAGAALLGMAYLVLVLLRVRRLRGVDRWVLMPVIASTVITAGPVVLHLVLPLLHDPTFVLRVLLITEAAALLAIPGALLVAVVRQRLARAAVADLVLRLGWPATTWGVRDALRETLRDPHLEVLYRLPDGETYVDGAGNPVPAPTGPGRFIVPITTGQGDPLALMVAEPSLERHRDLVDAAVTACGLAVENARLQASAYAQLQQVRTAQLRMAEAGLAERRRLERDLHDGAQQRLIGLSMKLTAAGVGVGDPRTLAVIEQVKEELHTALEELRDLAHGIHPAALSLAGLGPALASVAERLPLPVKLDVPAGRWDPAIEASAYFVACECLANTVKHARAHHAAVRISTESGALVIEVTDDGAGGADPGAGTGLTGVVDRVQTLGGHIVITSPPGAGTHIVARIPCE